MGNKSCSDCSNIEKDQTPPKVEGYIPPKVLQIEEDHLEPEQHQYFFSEQHDTISESFYHNLSPDAILKQFQNLNAEFEIDKKPLQSIIHSHDRITSAQNSYFISPQIRGGPVPRWSREQIETLRTDSALLHDSAFGPVKSSTFDLTKSIAPNPSDVIASRLTRHARAISQPEHGLNELNKSIDVIYCNEEDIVTKELPKLNYSRVLETFNKIKRLGSKRPRSQSWTPTSFFEARDSVYCSLVTEEVDDVSEVYIREPKEFGYEHESDIKIFNKDQRVIDIEDIQSPIKLNSALDYHKSYIDQGTAEYFEYQNQRFNKTEDITHSLRDERINISNLVQQNNHHEQTRATNTGIELLDDRLQRPAAQQTCFMTPEGHLEKINPLKESATHWFYNPAKQMRSDSISTNDNFSNRPTKPGSEENYLLNFSHPSEKECLVAKISEYEEFLSHGKFVESFIMVENHSQQPLIDPYMEHQTDSLEGTNQRFDISSQNKDIQERNHRNKQECLQAYVFPQDA